MAERPANGNRQTGEKMPPIRGWRWALACRRPPFRSGAAQIAEQRRTEALFRRQHHDHLAPFEPGVHLDLGDLFGIALEAIEQPDAELLVRHFAAPEPQRHLDLVALPEEADHRAHLHVIVM